MTYDPSDPSDPSEANAWALSISHRIYFHLPSAVSGSSNSQSRTIDKYHPPSLIIRLGKAMYIQKKSDEMINSHRVIKCGKPE